MGDAIDVVVPSEHVPLVVDGAEAGFRAAREVDDGVGAMAKQESVTLDFFTVLIIHRPVAHDITRRRDAFRGGERCGRGGLDSGELPMPPDKAG